MADITATTNSVAQPTGAIGGNAPPTPPETQDLKTTETKSSLPPPKAQPVDIEEAAASEPKPGKDGVTAAAAPDAPPAPVQDSADASKPVDVPQVTPLDILQKVAQAEELTAQPEKPEETARVELNEKPTNAEASASAAASATDADAKQPPKPVTMEEVQDAELPAVKPAPVSEPAKPGDSAAATAVQEPKEAKGTQDVDVPAVSQAKTPPQDVPNPEPAPVPSEPVQADAKTGKKRKALDEGSTNSIEAAAPAAAPERQGSPQKKQKLGDLVDGTEPSTTKKRRGSKREKKVPPPVGRTARKTRSQGAAETEKGL